MSLPKKPGLTRRGKRGGVAQKLRKNPIPFHVAIQGVPTIESLKNQSINLPAETRINLDGLYRRSDDPREIVIEPADQGFNPIYNIPLGTEEDKIDILKILSAENDKQDATAFFTPNTTDNTLTVDTDMFCGGANFDESLVSACERAGININELQPVNHDLEYAQDEMNERHRFTAITRPLIDSAFKQISINPNTSSENEIRHKPVLGLTQVTENRTPMQITPSGKTINPVMLALEEIIKNSGEPGSGRSLRILDGINKLREIGVPLRILTRQQIVMCQGSAARLMQVLSYSPRTLPILTHKQRAALTRLNFSPVRETFSSRDEKDVVFSRAQTTRRHTPRPFIPLPKTAPIETDLASPLGQIDRSGPLKSFIERTTKDKPYHPVAGDLVRYAHSTDELGFYPIGIVKPIEDSSVILHLGVTRVVFPTDDSQGILVAWVPTADLIRASEADLSILYGGGNS